MRQSGDSKYRIWAEGIYRCWHDGGSWGRSGRQGSSKLQCIFNAYLAHLSFAGVRFRACGGSSRSSIRCQAMVQTQTTCSRRVEGPSDCCLWDQRLSCILHGPEGLLLELMISPLYCSSFCRSSCVRSIWMNDWLASLSWMSEST